MLEEIIGGFRGIGTAAEVHCCFFAGGPAQLQSGTALFLAAQIVITCSGIVDEAVTVQIITEHLYRQRIFYQGNVDASLSMGQVTISRFRKEPALQLTRIGLFADNIDGSADGVSTEECALWPSQNLDAFNISHTRIGIELPRVIDTIDVHASTLVKTYIGWIRS